MGFPSWEYTPTYRGFDTFNGFLGGFIDYWNYTAKQFANKKSRVFYDIRDGERAAREVVEEGQYGLFYERDMTLDLLADLKTADDPFFLYWAPQAAHVPNEAPSEYADQYSSEENMARRMKQAQMTILDENVRDVFNYLKENEMWDDTLIVFSSDNGGDHNRGDNSPLRQYKNSSFEGGIRVPGFVTGGYLPKDRRGVLSFEML